MQEDSGHHPAEMMRDSCCERLRSLVQDCLSKHMYSSAVFFADKLVTMSGNSPGDVYLLAQAYFVSKQFRRAVMLIRRENLLDADVRFRYLAAKCLAACSDWDETLILLGDGDIEEYCAQGTQEHAGLGTEISLPSAVYLLRARAYEAMDNMTRAVKWYRAALRADPFCYEAFHALVGNNMLSNREELALVDAMPLSPEDNWLRLLYRCKCKKYEQHSCMEEQLAELERPAISAAQHRAAQQAAATPGGLDTPMGPASAPPGTAMHPYVSITPGALTPGDVMMDSPSSGPYSAMRTAFKTPAAATDGGDMESEASISESLQQPGWGLAGNTDVITCRADWCYHRGQYDKCCRLTRDLLERDPYATECMPAHLAAELALGRKNELFLRGHRLVDEHPKAALSWFAVGCYYMCTKQYENARRYFGKATTLDSTFAPAWIGFGHAFAALDESDQAMAAYRTAARKFPGLHEPLLGMGMEYQRMNNYSLAERMFQQAESICPSDPLIHNELGVLYYKMGETAHAATRLRTALDLLPQGKPTPAWEATVSNLGHALRKEGRYTEAIREYERALSLNPNQAGTFAALGYTQLLSGNYQAAIQNYHRALGLRPDDPFTTEMLTLALTEDCKKFDPSRDI